MKTQHIGHILENAIADKTFPGAVFGCVNKTGERVVIPAGNFTYSKNAPPMFSEAIFDVASITKAIPTSSLALKAIELGKITLEDTLIDWIPEYSSNFKKEVRLCHLLTQTLDFDFKLSDYKNSTPEKIIELILTASLQRFPGESFFYCNATSILLGMMIERVFAQSLADLAKEYFFSPLCMNLTSFDPQIFGTDSVVPTEIDPWRGREVRKEIHDESAWVLSTIMTPGSAGLFTCVPDILNFIEMLLNDGYYKSKKIIDSTIIKEIAVNQIPYANECTGLGWELNQSRYMGTCISDKTIGKTGFTGCVLVVDLQKEVGFSLFSNCTYPSRKQNAVKINAIRCAIADEVFR
jgi:CubicO group peptidase (beta-lactamase class C family)